MKKVQILSSEDIRQKTRRIAYQIVEDNFEEKELVIIGIKPNGVIYAGQLKREIDAIDTIKVTLAEVYLDKSKPLEKEIELKLGKLSLNDKAIIVVDDVANTGKTLYYALKPIMEFSPKKVQAAVLVDRQHKLFPISPDFVGLSLSTTLQEHIVVEFDKQGNGSAFLT
jgi:pyrimidine operon attenuation protein/uracil phosphoribosyltransferase